MSTPETITIDDTKYVRADSIAAGKAGPKNRHVVVLDRGWIIAGDLSKDEAGRISLGRPVLVRHWSGIGVNGMLANPKSSKVTLEKLPAAPSFERDVELFRFPVADDWGL